MSLEKSHEDSLASAATVSARGRDQPIPDAQAHSSLPLGTVVADRFEVTGELGQGGMGIVLSGRHIELGYSVAIKVLRSEWAGDAEAVTRFKREALTAASLKSPHVARVYEAGKLSDGRPFLVMEHLEGCDLGAHLAKRTRLPFQEAARWVLQACDAIAEAHGRGIVHRDLKPENLFLANEGERVLVKVVDFGISHIELPSEVRVTQDNSAFGTPLYMSPEAVRSAKLTDARTDVWALGVILYELVAGAPPFMGENLAAVAVAVTVDPLIPLSGRAPGIPAGTDALLAKAMAKKPDDRFPSARELGRALRALVDSSAGGLFDSESSGGASLAPAVPAVTSHETTAPAAVRGRSTGGVLLAAAIAFAVAAVAGLVWVLGSSPAAEPEAAAVRPAETAAATGQAPEITPGTASKADLPAAPTSASGPGTAAANVGPPPLSRPAGKPVVSAPKAPEPPAPTIPPPATKPTVKVTPGGAPLHL